MYSDLYFELFFILFTYCHSAEFDYTVEVDAGKTECFYQSVTNPEHVAIEIDYQVIDGGELDIIFYCLSPKNERLISDQREISNSHRIEIEGKPGDYGLCFDNSFSTTAKKIVFFEVFLVDKDGNFDDLPFEGLGDSKVDMKNMDIAVDDFKSRLNRIKNNLNRAEHYQSLEKVAEARDRSLMEKSYDRVNFWSVIHVGVMLTVLIVQVFMVRSLFEDDSRVGRMIRKAKLPQL